MNRLQRKLMPMQNTLYLIPTAKRETYPISPQSRFSFKKFFQLCGLSSKSPKEVKDVFLILDSDNSGYIEEAVTQSSEPQVQSQELHERERAAVGPALQPQSLFKIHRNQFGLPALCFE
ncbi:hypothetical protein DPEC_G00134510 [Dallia pectoralis]|uniref:Uncharacterized protein n=1 Tax=Dallia pectoralis TaxID=75939 RepID=A0ACC2GRV4_DALPE|nr:hypothetical protein DPEC_G00134510 [Dallia pectoralis]